VMPLSTAPRRKFARGLFMSHREVAAILGVSHGLIIIIERRALGKLMLGLGLCSYDELPARIRKFMKRPKAESP
jgi:hypothetical protein